MVSRMLIKTLNTLCALFEGGKNPFEIAQEESHYLFVLEFEVEALFEDLKVKLI